MTSKNEMKRVIESAGWHTWYHPNYWVHQDLVTDPKAQDYTNYGMTLEEAYEHELDGRKPFHSQIGFMMGENE